VQDSGFLGGSLDDVRAFCAVIDLGSISAAARHLRETKGGTSRRITRLERRLDTTLLARTPRAVTPTEEGHAFYVRASEALALLRDAAEGARHAKSLTHGNVRVTAPIDIGTLILPELIVRFRTLHPQITLELVLSDARLDLASNRIDLALRAGEKSLPDSGYHAVLVANLSLALYASPAYLARRSAPTTPKDLRDHDMVLYRASKGSGHFPLHGAHGEIEPFEPSPVVRTTNYASVFTLIRAGAGIGGLPDLVARPAVVRGELQRVLPSWSGAPAQLSAITLKGREAPARVKIFREFIRSALTSQSRQGHSLSKDQPTDAPV
jgi:DNA-binding transcriptional LysR family regulator